MFQSHPLSSDVQTHDSLDERIARRAEKASLLVSIVITLGVSVISIVMFFH